MNTLSQTPMLIGGRCVETGQTLEVVNPATGGVFAGVADADDAAIKAVLDAASEGFAVWSRFTPAERRVRILRYADLLEAHRDRLVELLIDETGKTQEIAEYDFGMLPTCLRFFVEEAERLDQPVLHDGDGRFLHYLLRQPLGVVVGMLAWNFPLLNLGYKLGPALAAGCSAIIKPATLTPLATLEAAHLATDAGIPDGVVNAIACTDHQRFATLLESERTALVTMIGSTRVGVQVMKTACTSVKHFSVELGGNAPVLVYPDADVAMAAEKIVGLKYANTGQVCVSPNRCFVHESVTEAFTRAAAAQIDRIVLGAGDGSGPRMGPMISNQARDEVLALVRSAVDEGAELVRGGHAVDGPGFFMQPTLLRGVKAGMEVAKHEVFGPVLSVISFGDEDDPIALANDSAYGLASYVFTRDLATGLRAAKEIQSGSVCVNEPHYSVQLPHGGMKQSGVGRDCSRYSIEEYLTLKRVSVLTE